MVLRVLLSGLVLITGVFIFSCENGEPPRNADGSIDGKKVFKNNCRQCHGANGDKGVSGAANLRVSTLSDKEMYRIIKYGSKNGQMMAYDALLSDEEIDALIQHIRTLQE